MTAHPSRGVAAGLCAALALPIGCTPARREVEGDIVRHIRFEGNGGPFSGHNDLQLRTVMAQKQSPPLTLTWPFLYLVEPVPLDTSVLADDSQRLEVWYAHHGWLDAEVDGWELRRVRDATARKAGVVDVIGHVAPGPVSVVREVHLSGSSDRAAAATSARGRIARSGVTKGSPLDMDAVRAATSDVQAGLQDDGYAWAEVSHQVEAWPEERRVEVTFHLDPGPVAQFGPVEVVGVSPARAHRVLDTLTFDWVGKDDPISDSTRFTLRDLRESQQRVYETGLFSLVNITPVLPPDHVPGAPLPSVAPIRVEVREAKARRVRLGAGLTTDYFVIAPKLQVDYLDRALTPADLTLEADANVGAVIGVSLDDDAGTPLFLSGGAGLRLEEPWLLRRRLALSVGARVTRDLQFGSLPYWRFQADFGLRYQIDPRWTFTAGPAFDYFQYTDLSGPEANAALLQFGPDFSTTIYRLLSFNVGLRYDSRNDPVAPRQGRFGSLDVRQSIPIPTLQGDDLQSGFLYTRVDGDLRLYAPFRIGRKDDDRPFVIAGRGHARVLVPWRSLDDALPYPDLAFLGGPNSLRGFRTQQVGAYDAVCRYPDGRPLPPHHNGEAYRVDRTYLPRGGALAIEGAAELRYDTDLGVGFAVFGDLGVLANRFDDLTGPSAEVVAQTLRGSAGVGLRYRSPVGPIRLDLGLRPLFQEDRSGPGRYFGCNAIDRLPRGFDLIGGGRQSRLDSMQPGYERWPVALNLLLSIGEAF
jgi:outer membrane protein assembly factor BamA